MGFFKVLVADGLAKLSDVLAGLKDTTIEVVIIVGHTDSTEMQNEDQRSALTELRARTWGCRVRMS